jgi:acetate---CoA ligase (ADP-forming)
VTAAVGEPDERTALERMLEARSVAVVGASVKEASLGRQMMVELLRGGFDGAIYPVNPGYEVVLGHRCYPSIADVPESVDLAILGVANQRVEQALSDAVAAGTRSAVTFSSLFEAEPPEPGMPPLAERVAGIAREAGIAMCGGNGMGFLNLDANLRATGFATPDHIRRGSVTFVSHSGSAFAAMAFNDRRIGFNLIVSSGQELVTDVADYIGYALGRPSTRVIALLIETVRRPDDFRAALGAAADADVPVVALKVGRTERSKRMVIAHSGALAGEDGAYEALFDAYGVMRVATLDEMADTMELFSSPRRVTTGNGIASIHDSGGERVLFVDVAADLGVPFAQISGTTTERIQDALDPGLEATNPLDAWGTGIDADRIFIECFGALHDDPEVAALAFVVDMTRQGEPFDAGYLHVAREVFAATTKPFCIVSNLASAVANDEAASVRDEGIPVLEGTASGLVALGHLLAYRAARERPDVVRSEAVADGVGERWRARLATETEISELEALSLLSDYGVPVTSARGAASVDEAIAAAGQVGWPVALKTAAPGVQHKSDVGGVMLGLADAEALRKAYEDLASRFGPQVVVTAMAPAGVEVALGIVRDPQFGPLVLVAAGGLLVEILHDRRLALPPLDRAHARALIDQLQMRPLLAGVRGAPAADIDALADAVVGLSVLAADLGEQMDALDVNPMIVSPGGCLAVDALVIPRRS